MSSDSEKKEVAEAAIRLAELVDRFGYEHSLTIVDAGSCYYLVTVYRHDGKELTEAWPRTENFEDEEWEG
jgi:hypothetical protein